MVFYERVFEQMKLSGEDVELTITLMMRNKCERPQGKCLCLRGVQDYSTAVLCFESAMTHLPKYHS